MKKFLKFMPHGQAHVITHEDGSVTLVSYQTEVAHLTADGWLTINGMYSKTTGRHIVAFIKEYAPTVTDQPYQTAKAMVESKFRLNITTGEVCDIEEVQAMKMRILKNPGYYTAEHNAIMVGLITKYLNAAIMDEDDDILTISVSKEVHDILEHFSSCDMVEIVRD